MLELTFKVTTGKSKEIVSVKTDYFDNAITKKTQAQEH